MGLLELGTFATVVAAIVAVLGYIRRDKSPKVEDNSQAQTATAGGGSQVTQVVGDVIIHAPVADTSSEPPGSSITIKLKAKGHGDSGWRYDLAVSFKNLSEGTFRDYRVEIEVPLFFLNPRTTYVTEVTARRTDSRAFFRTLTTHPNMPPVHPGDPQCAWTMKNIHTDDKIEDSEEIIEATLYVNDQQARKQELPIRDLFA